MRSEAWRLIRSGALPGSMNMALDDALLQAVANGTSSPVLRFYRWQPAALTIGYAQRTDHGLDLEACRLAGLEVVRRPTGGRAVLHDAEVTYAVIAPCAPPFGNSISTSYRVIAGVLQAALRALGVAAELVPGKAHRRQERAVCFTAPAQHELLVAGCKVAGCAQKRRGRAFLQHGSLPLDLDLQLLGRVLPESSVGEGARRLAGVGWLNRFAPRRLTIDEVEEMIIAEFATCLGVRLDASVVTDSESALAADLCRQFYANPVWTGRGPGWLPAAGGESDA